MLGIAYRSYLETVQALQSKLARSVLSKLVESKRECKISSSLCSGLKLTCCILFQKLLWRTRDSPCCLILRSVVDGLINLRRLCEGFATFIVVPDVVEQCC